MNLLKKKNKICLLIFVLIFVSFHAAASERTTSKFVMFYNVENLFDTERDTTILDADFTPTGRNRWTRQRYMRKLANVGKTIAAVGAWELPFLIGLSEVENRRVLRDLIRNSPLENQRFSIVHQDSPDIRGIDVALLYQRNRFSLIHQEFIAVEGMRTRDILYAAGVIPTGDTLHVFVNHWPSRIGGQLETEYRRVKVASLLRAKVDSIKGTTNYPRIIIMGDFNDTPLDRSIREVLGAMPPTGEIANNRLYNLFYHFETSGEIGTHRFRGTWSVIDHIIVSGTLLNKEKKIYTNKESSGIFVADFLIEEDPTHMGFRPRRTFIGGRYMGGVSDHLPVYVEFFVRK